METDQIQDPGQGLLGQDHVVEDNRFEPGLSFPDHPDRQAHALFRGQLALDDLFQGREDLARGHGGQEPQVAQVHPQQRHFAQPHPPGRMEQGPVPAQDHNQVVIAEIF